MKTAAASEFNDEGIAEEETPAADPIDYDAIARAAAEIAGKEFPSIEEVREILSHVSGSMADAVAGEREDRF